MKTKEQPELDVQTLEYVLAMLNKQKARYDKEHARYEEQDDEIMADVHWGKKQAMKYTIHKIENLILRQELA